MVHLTTALDPASAVPLYEQLYRSLAAEMRAGTLTAGTRMPGKRRLAAELSVSVNTVDTAYQMLAAEGYLTARERSGFTVQEYLALPQGVQPPAAHPAPPAEHPAETAPPVQFDLSTRGVDPGLFPFRTWARLQKELLYSAPELLTPGDARGDAALRQALMKRGFSQVLSYNVGTSIRKEDFVAGRFIPQDTFVFVGYRDRLRLPDVTVADSGMYACVYLNSFDDERDCAARLLEHCRAQGWTICGDYFCEILTEFNVFDDSKRSMFLRLQVPVSFDK